MKYYVKKSDNGMYVRKVGSFFINLAIKSTLAKVWTEEELLDTFTFRLDGRWEKKIGNKIEYFETEVIENENETKND